MPTSATTVTHPADARPPLRHAMPMPPAPKRSHHKQHAAGVVPSAPVTASTTDVAFRNLPDGTVARVDAAARRWAQDSGKEALPLYDKRRAWFLSALSLCERVGSGGASSASVPQRVDRVVPPGIDTPTFEGQRAVASYLEKIGYDGDGRTRRFRAAYSALVVFETLPRGSTMSVDAVRGRTGLSMQYACEAPTTRGTASPSVP